MGGSSGLHRIDVLDLVRQRALDPIDTGPLTGTHGLVFSRGKLWFTAQGSMAIARFDLASRQVDWIMGTGQNRTHMLLLTPDLSHIYATNVEAGSLSIFDLQPGPALARTAVPEGNASPGVWIHTVVSTEPSSEGMGLSPDGKEVWTAAATSGRIYIVDTATRRTARILDAKAVGANRVTFTHDGKHVLISSLSTGDVLVYDARSRTEIKRLRAGSGCSGLLIAPDDTRSYVACTSDNYVAVLDMKQMTFVDHIDVGPQPDGLAWCVQTDPLDKLPK
jgi:DNA-binding beta-propeller fold protein YncE